jgi:hypothetical protein
VCTADCCLVPAHLPTLISQPFLGSPRWPRKFERCGLTSRGPFHPKTCHLWPHNRNKQAAVFLLLTSEIEISDPRVEHLVDRSKCKRHPASRASQEQDEDAKVCNGCWWRALDRGPSTLCQTPDRRHLCKLAILLPLASLTLEIITAEICSVLALFFSCFCAASSRGSKQRCVHHR